MQFIFSKIIILVTLYNLILWNLVNADSIKDFTQDSIESKKQDSNKYTKKDFWLDSIKDKVSDFGYFENISYIFVSNKSLKSNDSPNLFLYDSKGKILGKSGAIVAQGKGYKLKEGDMTTPIGTYKITGKRTKLDQYYGGLAYTTNYPNALDKSLKRTGSGIWIHGKPLNGERKEKFSRGCIVIDNDIIHKYDKTLEWQKAILIVYEDKFFKASLEDISEILSQIHLWRDSLKNSDFNTFKGFYDSSFKLQNIKNFFESNKGKNLILTNINIAIYPTLQDSKNYVIYLNIKQNKQTKTHEIYIKLQKDSIKILAFK